MKYLQLLCLLLFLGCSAVVKITDTTLLTAHADRVTPGEVISATDTTYNTAIDFGCVFGDYYYLKSVFRISIYSYQPIYDSIYGIKVYYDDEYLFRSRFETGLTYAYNQGLRKFNFRFFAIGLLAGGIITVLIVR